MSRDPHRTTRPPPGGRGLLLIEAGGRRVYVEERSAGAGRPSWVVHADGALGEAARARVWATAEEAVGAILAEVARAAASPAAGTRIPFQHGVGVSRVAARAIDPASRRLSVADGRIAVR